MTDLLIWLFSAVAIMASLLLVFTRSILYGAYSLVICLLSLAALYVVMQAEFVGVTQLMIYVGGVIILILFAIMLTSKMGGKTLITRHYNRLHAIIIFPVSVAVFSLLAVQWSQAAIPERSMSGLMRETGVLLMTNYLLPMEIVAVLLLLVLIGALTIAGEGFRKEKLK